MANLGSAHFFDPRGRKDERKGANGKTFPGDHILFGYAIDTYSGLYQQSDYFLTVQVKSHFLTVAQNRSGKSTSLIVPNLINYIGSAVVIDVKGELSWLTFRARQMVRDQKVFILDPWGEVKSQYSNNARLLGIDWPEPKTSTFNPLSLVHPQSQHYAEDLAYIADALIINQSSNDPFWDESARELVTGLMSYLVETAPDNEKNFSTLRGLISLPLGQLKSVALEAQKLSPDSIARRKLGMFADDEGSSKSLASILSTAKQQTAIFDSTTLCRSLEGGEDVFSALLTEQGATVYLVLPVDKLQTYGRWLRLMVSFAIRAVARYQGKLNNQVMMFLDEFGTVGKLSAISQAYGLLSGRNLSIWAFIQDLNQLKKSYKEDWETFIANCQAISVFGVQDQTTSNYFSKMLGTQTVETISQATANEREKRSFWSGELIHPNYRAMNDKEQARPLLLPEELVQLTSSETEIGLLFGLFEPVLYMRMRYYEHKIFKTLAAPNPLIPTDVEAYREEEANREAAEFEKQKDRLIKDARKEYPNLSAFNEILRRTGWNIKVSFLGWLTVTSPKSGHVFKGFKGGFYNYLIEEAAKATFKNNKEAKNIQSDTEDEQKIQLVTAQKGRTSVATQRKRKTHETAPPNRSKPRFMQEDQNITESQSDEITQEKTITREKEKAPSTTNYQGIKMG